MILKKYMFILIAFILAMGTVACNDSSTIVPDDLSVDGSYFIIRRTYTADGEQLYNRYPPDISGVLTINSLSYTIEMEGYASEVGTVVQDGINVDFYPEDSDIVILGSYVMNLEQIKMSYTAGNVLFTEVWQKATVIDSVASQ